MSVTHIAGSVIVTPDRVIQRCALCGEKLTDVRPSRVRVESTGKHGEIPNWRPDTLVRVDGNSMVSIPYELDEYGGQQLPVDNCLPLVEEA